METTVIWQRKKLKEAEVKLAGPNMVTTLIW